MAQSDDKPLERRQRGPSPTGIGARRSWIGGALAWTVLATLAAAEPPSALPTTRSAWTTSNVLGSPEPALPYVTERAFPGLQFNQCLDIVFEPGTDRAFVVEQSGKIFSFPHRPDVKSADLVIDLAKEIHGVEQVYSLAFHPNYQENRLCFVCYIKGAELHDGTHVARFRVTQSDPPRIDVGSEATIITWLSGGHNGCCLKFGPDGDLYISTGDGGPANPPDPLRAGQDVGNLLSAILRIDVDHVQPRQNYRIPSDNPFVDLAGARGEIWAYGFRNPWRMSFDRKTGDLWVGDVGWERWEMLQRVVRGGNYGWAVMEGRQPTNPEWPRGPTPILPPTIDHPHSESSSITDGLTYWGDRLPELAGTHLYSDYDTGKFWGFRFVEGRVVDRRELADTTHRVVGFGEAADGEFYILDHTAGTLHRLIPNPRFGKTSRFPRKWSQTGLARRGALLDPAPGVVPYAINAARWMDHAAGERWVALPGTSSIRIEEPTWVFPTDAVLAKTLSMDVESGGSSSRRPIETQILHFDGAEWMPYTYAWNADGTDADLVDAGGAERVLTIADPRAPNGTRRQTWRFAGRAECQRCHNKWSGPVLGFNTPQLHRPVDRNGSATSQLDALTGLGILDKTVAMDRRPSLVDPRDAAASVDERARAYLHANCSHCHRMHAGGSVLSFMHFDLPIDQTNMVGVRPTQGTFGIHTAQVITPGDPFRSVLWYRMAKTGNGRMPYLGSLEVDREGLALLHDWIQGLSAPNAGLAAGRAESRPVESAAAVARLVSAPEADRQPIVDQLLASPADALAILWGMERGRLPSAIGTVVVERASASADAGIRDLFERFLPPERRVQRLGSAIRPEQITSLAGDARRGQRLFFETSGVACKNCHRIGKDGKEVGPDLSTIGRKWNREQLLESLLDPSLRIDPPYVVYLAEIADGTLSSGLLVRKDDREVVLKTAEEKLVSIPAKDVERLVPQRQSLMPDLLLRDLTAQQVADLLEYLGSLK